MTQPLQSNWRRWYLHASALPAQGPHFLLHSGKLPGAWYYLAVLDQQPSATGFGADT